MADANALQFSEMRVEDSTRIAPFFYRRPNKTCDSCALDSYLWREYCDILIAEEEDKALFLLMDRDGEKYTAMPYCDEEALPVYFKRIEEYFNEVLKQPLKIYLADEEAIKFLTLEENPRYLVKEEEDFKDYLYDAEELRTLPSKRFHKKKNLVNKFKREYEGRWEYRSICCSEKQVVWDFLDRWYQSRVKEEGNGEDTLEYEIKGIHEVLQNCMSIDHYIGGIFVDGRLEAFSIGAYNPKEEMACISIEKGNPEIPGIYQVINQEFLLHEFPQAKLVNREDDMGLAGLRKAKESYNPIGFARKYMLVQKDFRGYENYVVDKFEEEVMQYEQEDSAS
jgi:hypothetical protein